MSEDSSFDGGDGISDDQPAILHVSPITVEATVLSRLGGDGEGSTSPDVQNVNEPLIVS